MSLKYSSKQFYNPKPFCESFKNWNGNPLNLFEQMDAEEFFNLLMDRLKNKLKDTSQKYLIKNHFDGILSNELICKGCPHYSEREESFLTVSLQVKNKNSIQKSLESFIEGEMLEGENAYHCEKCDKKVTTLKRICFKKLPNHLILVLKRFEYDFDYDRRVKINDYCEFPTKLNMENYTQQGLRKNEKEKINNRREDLLNESKDFPSEYFEYELKGIVIHIGIAESGHYYSLINERENSDNSEKWYEFNDSNVTFFDSNELPNETYGGINEEK